MSYIYYNPSLLLGKKKKLISVNYVSYNVQTKLVNTEINDWKTLLQLWHLSTAVSSSQYFKFDEENQKKQQQQQQKHSAPKVITYAN